MKGTLTYITGFLLILLIPLKLNAQLVNSELEDAQIHFSSANYKEAIQSLNQVIFK